MVKCVISCPLDTYSGYGKRAFDFVKELMRVYPDWQIEILSQRWGDCRFGYLKDHGEYEIMGHLVSDIAYTPDVWIQITIPSEFQPVGKFNIGITAAMETTLSHVDWIRGCNRMDLVLTSSEHGRKSLVNTVWTMNQTKEELKVRKPVEVLFEGVDTNVYHPSNGKILLPELKNNWNFLCVGHWMRGNFGQDRKNMGYTVKAFLEVFKDREGQVPGLILKTSQAISSIPDRYTMVDRINQVRETVKYKKSLPNIYLLHGDLTDEEMNGLYCDPRIKAMVSFTKGEGYGRPLIEFAAVGKPIIASGWSGHTDFLRSDVSALVGGTLENVDPSAVQEKMILKEAKWFKPDDDSAVNLLNDVFVNYASYQKKAASYGQVIRKDWNIEAMGQKIKEIFDRYIPDFPEEVELTLPNIEKVQ